jgi:hypothetical protein
MAEDDKTLERLVLVQVMHLNGVVLGVTLGLFLGLSIFAATNILILKGGEVVGPHLALLGEFFWGYQVTFGGSFIGLLYGFFVGFVVGYLFARIYNWLAYSRENRRSVEESRSNSPR